MEPQILATYLLQLSSMFHKYYAKNRIINEAKEQANTEAEKILTSTKEQISNEKMKALTELKNQVAELSIEMTEKILKSELSDAVKQKEFVSSSLKQNELN